MKTFLKTNLILCGVVALLVSCAAQGLNAPSMAIALGSFITTVEQHSLDKEFDKALTEGWTADEITSYQSIRARLSSKHAQLKSYANNPQLLLTVIVDIEGDYQQLKTDYLSLREIVVGHWDSYPPDIQRALDQINQQAIAASVSYESLLGTTQQGINNADRISALLNTAVVVSKFAAIALSNT